MPANRERYGQEADAPEGKPAGDTGKEMIQREHGLKDQLIDAAQVIAFPFILTAALVAATLWVWYASGGTCTDPAKDAPATAAEVCRWITPDLLRDLIQNSAFAIAIGAAGDWLMFSRLTKERNEAIRIANEHKEETHKERREREQERREHERERAEWNNERSRLLEMLQNQREQS